MQFYWEFFFNSIIFIISWGVFYYLTVFWALKTKDIEKKYETSFDYMTKNP